MSNQEKPQALRLLAGRTTPDMRLAPLFEARVFVDGKLASDIESISISAQPIGGCFIASVIRLRLDDQGKPVIKRGRIVKYTETYYLSLLIAEGWLGVPQGKSPSRRADRKK